MKQCEQRWPRPRAPAHGNTPAAYRRAMSSVCRAARTLCVLPRRTASYDRCTYPTAIRAAAVRPRPNSTRRRSARTVESKRVDTERGHEASCAAPTSHREVGGPIAFRACLVGARDAPGALPIGRTVSSERRHCPAKRPLALTLLAAAASVVSRVHIRAAFSLEAGHESQSCASRPFRGSDPSAVRLTST
jgi:hypothetical protein